MDEELTVTPAIEKLVNETVEKTWNAAGASREEVAKLAADMVMKSLREDQRSIVAVPDLIAKKFEHRSPYASWTDNEKGMGLAIYCRALAASQNNLMLAKKLVEEEWMTRYKDNPFYPVVAKALGESTISGGGVLVRVMYGELIELLRAMSVVRKAGARIWPLGTGTAVIPKRRSGATAYFVGEGRVAPKSESTYGQIVLTLKDLIALTAVPNQLLRDAAPEADVLIRDDLVDASAEREDIAFIRGDGTANTPRGLRYWIIGANRFNSSGTTLDQVSSDLTKMIALVQGGNVRMRKMGWIMSPRSFWFLRNLKDANGHFVYAAELKEGLLYEFPVYVTTNVPNTLGSGNKSEIYLADFSEAIIGDAGTIDVKSFDGGAYNDGSQVVAGISTNETVIRSNAAVDFCLRHEQAGAVLEEVSWGA